MEAAFLIHLLQLKQVTTDKTMFCSSRKLLFAEWDLSSVHHLRIRPRGCKTWAACWHRGPIYIRWTCTIADRVKFISWVLHSLPLFQWCVECCLLLILNVKNLSSVKFTNCLSFASGRLCSEAWLEQTDVRHSATFSVCATSYGRCRPLKVAWNWVIGVAGAGLNNLYWDSFGRLCT